MNKSNSKITTIAYPKTFRTRFEHGWGCGYVIVDNYHPFARYARIVCSVEDTYYPQVKLFSEEITYYEELDNSIKIGFDTAQTYNDASHNEEWVTKKAQELKQLIDAYSDSDVEKLKQKLIDQYTQRINNF